LCGVAFCPGLGGTKAVNLPTGFLAGFLQRREEKSAVVIVAEDRFPVIAAIHHMVNCARILDTQLASHTPGRDKQCTIFKSIDKR
jgi:hypothetical protein